MRIKEFLSYVVRNGNLNSGQDIALAVCGYREGKGITIFEGETLEIPNGIALTFTGSLREVDSRVREHMRYIAQTLADRS